ncbi:MAG: hypothetical protein KIS77_11275 [Saprospiraceae bacterium]|nr:hypothetical protein [Saprospiraceae bacterium]
MKQLNFIFLFICLVSAISCKKEDDVIIYGPGKQEFGWAKGTKEGKAWEASGFWRYHQNDSTLWGIDFYTYSSFGEQREHFALNEIPLSIGTFPVKGRISDLGDGFVGGSFGQWGDDGDVLIGFMGINDKKHSFITISEIDTLTDTMKGFFEIHFISDDESLKIEIKNGKFEVRLYK